MKYYNVLVIINYIFYFLQNLNYQLFVTNMLNLIYYFLILILSLPVYAQVTISSGSFSSSNLSSKTNSQTSLINSNNAVNGLCKNGIIKRYQNF